jgi:hydrogenase expression/formation protein HypC
MPSILFEKRTWNFFSAGRKEPNDMCLAVPGKIMSISDNEPLLRTGKVNFGGIIKEVNLACTPEAGVGDYVIVHVGFAISTLDAKEASQVFEYLKQMGELEDLKDPQT